MKQGKTLPEFVAELDRQQTAKRDFIADSTQLQMLTVEQSNAGSRTGVRLEVPINGHSETFNVADNTHNQLSARLGIPKRYYDVMLAREPGLLANNVNTWLHRKPERRMVRTLDGTARAFLSDRYRRLDNYDLAQAVLPVLTGANTEVRIESTQITDTRMYIKALFPRIEGEIKQGDVVQSGIVISNSEIGLGSLRVEPLVYKLSCKNVMITSKALNDVEEGITDIFRDVTRETDDKAFFLKVQDIVRASINDTEFNKAVERIRDAAARVVNIKPVELVQNTARRFLLSDGESEDVLTHLIRGSDLSAWGLCNAVTRASQDVLSYDRATELERIGEQIIDLAQGKDWEAVTNAV